MTYKPTILVTGFMPFNNLKRNSSWEGVKLLPDEILGCRIIKKELPVKWFECTNLLYEYMEEYKPHAVLGFGQGYAVPPLLIERIGMNICNGPNGDFKDVDIIDEPIFYGAPAAYFSTIPYAAMHKRLKKEGIPVRYNFNAGQNQCNCLLYSALHFAATRYPGTIAGFVHVPMLPNGTRDDMMPLEVTAKGIEYCVEEVCKTLIKPIRTIEQIREEM